MNPISFVDAIRTAVYNGAAKDTLDILERPSGRRPRAALVTLSEWYHRLSSEDRQNLAEVVHLAAKQSAYNFLLVLDGLLAIEPAGTKGKLELFYSSATIRMRLNDENADQLSSVFKQDDP